MTHQDSPLSNLSLLWQAYQRTDSPAIRARIERRLDKLCPEWTTDTEGTVLIPTPGTYRATDGYGDTIEIDTDSTHAAAQEYVDGGDWGESQSTSSWVTVCAWLDGIDADGQPCRVDECRHKIEIEPEEPECIDDEGHDWQNPYAIVGGLKENPGVYGHGGGVIFNEVCVRCGCGKQTDTWAQDLEDGEQGLTSVEYTPEQYIEEIAPVYSWSVEDGVNAGNALITVSVARSYAPSREIASAMYVVDANGDTTLDTTSDGCGDNACEANGEWPEPPSNLVDEAQELAAVSDDEAETA